MTLAGTLRAGDDRSPADNVALATLAGAMLDKGTTKRDKFAIAQTARRRRREPDFLRVGPSTLQFGGKCLRKDLPLVISLLAEQLRPPAFSEAEFAKLKKQLAGSIQQQLEDTDFRADDEFSRAVYPSGHPNRQPTPEEFLAAIQKATLADVSKFHSQFYGPAGMRLVLVGDVDPAAAQATVRDAFAGWSGGSAPAVTPKARALDAERTQTVFMPDKDNVSVIIGQPTRLTLRRPRCHRVACGDATFSAADLRAG